ncbi:MAG: enoyl-CoA hydratase/isomerase family protein [Actinomycetota bacterium]|nr:enoyl-CoA hydratase/isomerase family protein [Actinomycetota bacterium]
MGISFPDDLTAAVTELEADSDVRVVLVTGEGSSFSSGLDLDDLGAGLIDVPWFRANEILFRRLESMGKPVIAGVAGWCLGGGLQIAIACDVRIAADDARFGLPAAKEAFLPGMGTWRLPRLVGMGWARHLILSGEPVDAAEALRIGLVHKVVPRTQLEEELMAWAKRYGEVPAASVAWAKQLCNQAYDLPFEGFLDELSDAMAVVISTEEHLALRRAWAARHGEGGT